MLVLNIQKLFKKNNRIIILSLLMVIVMCSSCVNTYNERLPIVEDYEINIKTDDKKVLKLGVVAGPYNAMFIEGIQPILAQKGYTVEIIVYDNYAEPNYALANGEIDLNMIQNYTALNDFKFEHDLDLSAITEMPTAPMGIYSIKHKSLESLSHGAVIAIPDDDTHISMALSVIESSGLITLDTTKEKTRVSVHDIIKNPKNLIIKPIDSHLLAQTLNLYDLAVIDGGMALAGGLQLSDALFTETKADNHMIVIAARTIDLRKAFVIDVIDAVSSDQFKAIFNIDNEKYIGFQYPRGFLGNEH